jgi:hypothetical protein
MAGVGRDIADGVTGIAALGDAEGDNVKASLPNFTYTSAMSAGWLRESRFAGRIPGLPRSYERPSGPTG